MARTDEGKLLEAIAVTAELTGTDLSSNAAKVMAADLGAYPLEQVLGGLKRCRQEVKGRLTIADVVSRLDDGRPGAEEAWAMIPQDEKGTVVWTGEMAEAFGVCYRLIEAGDHVAARMAFRETYAKLVAEARSHADPVIWTPSLGHDPTQRAAAIEIAVLKGRMLPEHAAKLLPPPDAAPAMLSLAATVAVKLADRREGQTGWSKAAAD